METPHRGNPRGYAHLRDDAPPDGAASAPTHFDMQFVAPPDLCGGPTEYLGTFYGAAAQQVTEQEGDSGTIRTEKVCAM